MGHAYDYTKQAFSNPAGTEGFEFVEFSSPDPTQLAALFKTLGFHAFAQHQTRPLTWFKQGDIHFLVSTEGRGFASEFSQQHGPSACAMGFKVSDADKAYQYAISREAQPCKRKILEFGVPAIYGIGESLLYLVDDDVRKRLYQEQFKLTGESEQATTSAGLTYIDHLTHNVHNGHMDTWSEFYERVFNFREIRYFDIQGKMTGLRSRAMTSPCGNLRIPINESSDDKSQIVEFLQEYHGEGIQHIALGTDDIYHTVATLKANGIKFMDVPDTYYDMIAERLPEHHEAIDQLRKHRILIDGHMDDGKLVLLLQTFTKTLIGPIFFEIIQRKGDEGFGEGNFQALFESIERDQVARGVIIDKDN
ncbi:4-hydroxyphenylpyruvate dioxygenase [Moritella marina ATCC 15381]|uniref:4-hydroxyphenylpyruvate dioxygenase n=1 Tax=Moritella marina ATCC 15381 TaxID=1202962 RepID=A0A5J6WMR6_MORMI|nr:4-hydroxyphenylpyruvate dioxygenase [Moritella marina]QFI39419.1 4-hydroxyphenylpyruvate dioxygenase [Moritella marina ATCC 15381]